MNGIREFPSATIIQLQRVFEIGKGRMAGSLMDTLGSREGLLVSESFVPRDLSVGFTGGEHEHAAANIIKQIPRKVCLTNTMQISSYKYHAKCG